MTITGVAWILGIVVYVGGAIIIGIDEYKSTNDTPIAWGLLASWFFTIIYAVVAMAFIGAGNVYVTENTPVVAQAQERNLSALTLTSNTGGSYSGGLFLSRGSIGSEDYYVVATVNGDGFSKIEKLPVDQVVYKETDEEVPRVVQTDMVRDTSSAKAKFWKVKPKVTSTSYALYIPKGSVSTEMNVNLENL